MLAKMTSKNQLTLPRSVTNAIGQVEYFDVQTKDGQIILTPVRIQRADAVRAKLAELDLKEQDIADAVAWARQSTSQAEKMSRPPRVVLDTNLVLSALVFAQGRLVALRQAWQDGHCVPLVSRTTAAELIRVLAYPKFKLSDEEQQELLADYLPWCATVRIPNPPPVTPVCRDPSDQPFLQLAVAGKADYLVSGDHDLLSLADQFDRPIVMVEQFLKIHDR